MAPIQGRPRIIGILGGTSHVIATAYYDLINAASNRRLGGSYYGETIMMGMNFGAVADLAMSGQWDAVAEHISQRVDQLEAAGAELIIGSSNTVHNVMREVMAGRDVDFLPITEPLIAAIKASGLKRIAIFGTRATMDNGAVMQEVREATGVELIVPNADEREEINRVIFEELVNHEFKPESRAFYRETALRLARDEGAEGVILGCTEIFLLIDEPDLPEMKVFATARLHCEAAVARAFGESA
ncbi:MAG: amino acid racemase [Pseudomonadota bacterium]